MAEIEWTDEAKYWLQQIYDYLSNDSCKKPRNYPKFLQIVSARRDCFLLLYQGIVKRTTNDEQNEQCAIGLYIRMR